MFKRILFIAGPIILIAGGFLLYATLKKSGGSIPADALKPKILNYWRVFDDPDDFATIIGAWNAMHPKIQIIYRKLKYEEYEQALLEAWAKGEGPDIFSIQNNWTGKYQDFIAPMPDSTSMAYYSKTKVLGVKEETKVEYKKTPSLKLHDIQVNYVDTVYQDAIIGDKVYGLPLSVDTLALFYNRDLLSQAKIAVPPQNYDEFMTDSIKMTILDKEGNIVQSGAALGTTNNIPRAIDILTLFMLQTGTPLQDLNLNGLSPNDPTKSLGAQALEFFAQFADKTKEAYCWNEDMPGALEQFAKGKLAFYFGYSYQIPTIDQLSQGQVKYEIIPLPKLNQDVNFANYWLETVSKQSPYANEAWDFIQFAAKAENVVSYLNKVNKPTALRALINSQAEDVKLNPFVTETLIAKNWYHGKKPGLMEQYLSEAVDKVRMKEQTAMEALQTAQNLIQQTY